LNQDHDGVAAINLDVDPEIGTNQPGRDLTPPDPDAVREYLIAAGITPELFELR